MSGLTGFVLRMLPQSYNYVVSEALLVASCRRLPQFCASICIRNLAVFRADFDTVTCSLVPRVACATEELVYLTADSPDTITRLEKGKVYILGGLVDRNAHKGLCLKKAAVRRRFGQNDTKHGTVCTPKLETCTSVAYAPKPCHMSQ